MADETEKSSRTEAPSGKRLEDARRQGDVAKSPDVPAFMVLAAAAGVVLVAGAPIARGIAMALIPFLAHPDAMSLSGHGAVLVMRLAAEAGVPALAVLAAAAVAGAAGNLIQHGFLFAPAKLAPDLAKLNPAEGFKRLFGLDSLVAFGKNTLKFIAVGAVVWFTLKPRLVTLQNLAALDPAAILPVSMQILRTLFISVLVFLGLGAGLDWLWQRYRFIERLRMTREELKQETKDSEGDPHIKARQRQIRVARAKKRMIQNVPKATVVVTNPTHYAVALRYVKGETAAPVCVAKGVDKLALRIREVATEHKVPIVEDPPLARALYAAMEIDEAIPREHYEAVAKIIGFVMGAAKSRARRGRPAMGAGRL